MSTGPTTPYGLDLRQAVVDHLGPDPLLDVEQVLHAVRRTVNWCLPDGVLLGPDSVVARDPSVDVAAALREAWAAVDLDVVIAELRPLTVAMTISGDDFQRLVVNSSPWAEYWDDTVADGWLEWLESTTGTPEEPVGGHWRFAYRMGDQWSTVMLVRAYLDAIGQRYQILWDAEPDENDEPGGYLVLTDYATAGWHHRPSMPRATALTR